MCSRYMLKECPFCKVYPVYVKNHTMWGIEHQCDGVEYTSALIETVYPIPVLPVDMSTCTYELDTRRDYPHHGLVGVTPLCAFGYYGIVDEWNTLCLGDYILEG